MDTAATVQPSRPRASRTACARRCGAGSNVALPPLCPSCRDLVTDNGLCPACWSKLAFIAPPYCPRLGIPFAYDPGPGILSMQAIADPPAYQPRPRGGALRRRRAHAGACLQVWRPARSRAADRPLDGARRPELLAAPTRSCRCRCTGGGCGRAASTSRPRSPQRSRARAASPVAHAALRRVKATAQQVGLSRSRARHATCRARSASRPPRKAEVAGRRLILVDDVLTSGATVGCLRAGAVARRRRAGRRAGIRPGC